MFLIVKSLTPGQSTFPYPIKYQYDIMRITGGNPRRLDKMTNETVVANATHKIGTEIKYESDDGSNYTVMITVKMPQNIPDDVWDAIHTNFSKLEDVAASIMRI